MKVLNLEISGFGPYGDCQKIDFTQLGENGLFLITGDTGAGKTTVFDAIVYALFGEASGGLRTGDMMRSDFAPADTKTYVKLSFSYKDETYVVERNPNYERPAKRGDKTVKAAADASLTYPDGRVVVKSKAVTEAVEILLGINGEQFGQIVMIAQGDFLKLLLADSASRSRIFQKIFNTGVYADIQAALKEEALNLKNTGEKIKDSIFQYIAGVNWNNHLQFAELSATLVTNKDIYKIPEFLEALQTVISEDSQLQKTKEANLQTLQSKLARINGELATQNTVNQQFAQLQCAKETQGALEDRQAEMDTLAKTLVLNENALYRVKPHQDHLAGTEAEVKTIQERLQQSQSDLTILKADYEAADQAFRAVEDAPKRISELALLLAELQKDMNRYKQLSGLNAQLVNAQNDAGLVKAEEKLEVLRQQLGQQEEVYQQSMSTCQQAEHEFFAAQAGILAKDLKTGMACPVCGATSHPNLAPLEAQAPTEAEIKKLQVLREKALDKRQRIFSETKQQETLVASEKIRRESTMASLRDQLARLKAELTYSDEKEAAKVYGQLETEQKTLQKTYDQQKKRLEECHTKFITATTLIETLGIQLTEGADKAEQAQMNYQQALKEGGFQDTQMYTRALISPGLLEEKRRTIQGYKTQCDKVGSTIELLSQQLQGKKEASIEGMEQASAQCGGEIQECQNELKALYARLQNNQDIFEAVTAKMKSSSAQMQQYEILKDLADTANGETKGRAKISFERYIQRTYFEQIIYQANMRFRTMSSGRYQLAIGQPDGNRSQSGLELEVFDAYTGKSRSVKSLSGGEAFKASLSLALGLSDVIQSYAGGVCLESMFVDEGFGTLDAQSLDQAIETLVALADNHRIVGIISHVEELKNRIDKKIIVTKGHKGSQIQVVSQ